MLVNVGQHFKIWLIVSECMSRMWEGQEMVVVPIHELVYHHLLSSISWLLAGGGCYERVPYKSRQMYLLRFGQVDR